MKTSLKNYSVQAISEGFVYNELEGKGLYGLAGKLTIQPEYQRNYIYADGIAVQARLVGVGNKLSNGTVVAVDRIKAVGLYNPHTLQGDLLVNGIVASSYTDAIPPYLAHSLLAPLRIMYGRKEFSGI